MNITRYGPRNNSRTRRTQLEKREHVKRHGRSTMGRVEVFVTCPFCGHEVMTYLWSLAGSGKLCPKCRAKHSGQGYSTK
jgi:hypothetical protein